MNATKLTVTSEMARDLGQLTNRDEAGRHFTEWAGDLDAYEAIGLVRIDRPVHAATGIPYSQEYWTLAVCPLVGTWFDSDGELREDDFPRDVDADDCADAWAE